MDRERDEQGRYEGKIDLEDVVRVLSDSDKPVMTAKQVAESLDCSREAARQKLHKLHDNGTVEKMQVGSRAVVWWNRK